MKDESKVNQRDVLIDEGKQADIEVLGDCLRALSDGQTLGDLSLTGRVVSSESSKVPSRMSAKPYPFLTSDCISQGCDARE
jgi:type IV secretion system protein VirB4